MPTFPRDALAAAALLLVGARDAPSLPMREARWTAPDALFAVMTRQPPECLAASGESERQAVETGRVLFRAPLLMGGQAARAGMSCATCHRNGRGNPDFLFPGLSGARGTADVTSSLMSSHRGDRIVNPKSIPDLAGPRKSLKISRDPADPALVRFIRGLVVEEFDGAEPPGEAIEALAAYVRMLRPEVCHGGDREIRLADQLREVDTAVKLARGTKGEMRRLLLSAARSALGTIDEQFTIAGLEGERGVLRSADGELQTLRLGTGAFDRWDSKWPAWRRQLLRSESRSFFAPRHVRRALHR